MQYAINSEFRLPLIQSREILGRETSVMFPIRYSHTLLPITKKICPSHLQIHWLTPTPPTKVFRHTPENYSSMPWQNKHLSLRTDAKHLYHSRKYSHHSPLATPSRIRSITSPIPYLPIKYSMLTTSQIITAPTPSTPLSGLVFDRRGIRLSIRPNAGPRTRSVNLSIGIRRVRSRI